MRNQLQKLWKEKLSFRKLNKKHFVFFMLMFVPLFWGFVGFMLLNVSPSLGLLTLLAGCGLAWAFWKVVYREAL